MKAEREELQEIIRTELQSALAQYKGAPITKERRTEILEAVKKLLSTWDTSTGAQALIPKLTHTRILRDVKERRIHVRLQFTPLVYRNPGAAVLQLPTQRMTRVGRYTVPACRDCEGKGELPGRIEPLTVECSRCEGTGVEP